jgi:hypothetical protein
MAEEALRDQELFDRVREIVDEEAGELERRDRVIIEARWGTLKAPPAWKGHDEWEVGDIHLKPSAAGASEIWMSIWDDTGG